MEPEALAQPLLAAPPPKPPVPKAVIAACVLASALGLALCVSAVTKMQREMREDAREEILDLDDRSPAELEAEKLLRDTERLETEKAQLQRECTDVEERLAALSARAPEMPPIRTWVAVADGGQFIFLAAGSDDRIEKGFQFAIKRSKKVVARVVVQEVTERACACRVLIVKDGDRIEVGDDAVTRLD